MKGKWIVILLVLVLLVGVLAVLIKFRDKDVDRDSDFCVRFDGELYYLSFDDLSNIPTIDVNPPGGEEKFTCYSLPTIAESLGIEWSEIKEIYLSSDDGSKIKIGLEEANNDEALLSLFKEQPLRFRVIFPLDEFRNRWLKNIFIMDLA